MGKKTLALAAVLLVSVMAGGCAGNQQVGVVDVNKVMEESPKVQQFEEQLRTAQKSLVEKLDADKPNLSQEDLQKRIEENNSQLMKQQQDLSSQINTAMDQAFADIAKEKNLSVVLYKNGVAQGGTDITDEVIKKMQ